mmetsp:Transcript_49572/g.56075  ORF Transcript_49572/g.56075 Transcript_49572/m.56075 type:complete len:669 (+) Transcript_49572:69-2075(+)
MDNQEHEHQMLSSSNVNDKCLRRKKSYLNRRTRSKNNNDLKDDSISVKDSLSIFLADTELQDEDLLELFQANDKNDGKDTNINKTDGKKETSNGDNNNNDSQESLFDREALLKVSRDTKSRPRRTNNKKILASGRADRKGKTGREREQRRRRSKTPKTKASHDNGNKNNNNNNSKNSDDDDIDVDAKSFAIDTGNESDISISSSDSKKKKRVRKRSQRKKPVDRSNSVSRRRSSRSLSRVPSTPRRRSSRSISRLQSTPRLTPSRSRSKSTTSGIRSPRRTISEKAGSNSNSNSNKNGIKKSLSMGLDDLNRQVRRDRMKKGYRQQDNGDGGESVASGMSHRSNYTTRSSYKPSGLEGGALNAFMGIEHIAQNASRGRGTMTTSGNCSVANEPADENYRKERKVRQDLIMDVALKEKWRHEAEVTKEAERLEKEKFASKYYSSDEEIGTKKKKGLVNEIKKAARKTAKASKSGAKGATNVVKDPKRAAKKAGKVTKGVGKEAAKIVMDPSLAAKQGTRGIKGTLNLTANVAKGSFDVTSLLTRKGIQGTAMVVGGTINGAGKVVHGATDIIFKQEDEEDVEVYDDYNPRSLSDRADRQVGKETFSERLSIYDDLEDNRKSKEKEFDSSSRSEIRRVASMQSQGKESTIPALEIKTISKANKNNGWWDI